MREGAGQLFSFFDRRGHMQTVERRSKVPEEARGEVMVTVPGKLLGGDRVIIADLRHRKEGDTYRSWIGTRAEWLARTMPKASVLKEPPVVVANRGKKKAPKKTRHQRPKVTKKSSPAVAAAPTPPPTPAAPPATKSKRRVVVFSTSWCPSCRRALAFLRAKKVPFVELDVERDPRAARAYQIVCRQHGLKVGSVPVIMVGERVFQGFSPFQIEVAINQLMKGS